MDIKTELQLLSQGLQTASYHLNNAYTILNQIEQAAQEQKTQTKTKTMPEQTPITKEEKEQIALEEVQTDIQQENKKETEEDEDNEPLTITPKPEPPIRIIKTRKQEADTFKMFNENKPQITKNEYEQLEKKSARKMRITKN